MGLFDKIGGFLKREAADIAEAVDGARDKLDAELSAREAELAMTPSEKIRAIQQRQNDTDAELDRIADEVVPNRGDDPASDDLQARLDRPVETEPVEPVEPHESAESELPTEPVDAVEASAPSTSAPTFEKSPAEKRYEEARQAADDLLAELRRELHDDGDI